MDIIELAKIRKMVGGSGGGGGGTGGGDSGEEWIGDGNTYIWITLQDGRTSPMLGVCPNGTVKVDWGDGTTPDVLTGTSVLSVKWTPAHEYAMAGDYIIKLTVDGEMGFYGTSSTNQWAGILRYSSESDARNSVYLNSVKKVEAGNGVIYFSHYVFRYCSSLASITIPEGVTLITTAAFDNCSSLASIIMPEGVTSIGNDAFKYCSSLASITIPNSVTSIGKYAFENCWSLASITIPNGVTSIDSGAFRYCYSLVSITIPNSVTSIGDYAFYNCRSLASITIPNSVTSIKDSAFYGCVGMRYYDFTNHTSVPTLASTYALYSIPSDCEIRVPAALYDEWIAATNWSTYASNIVAV